ncbi:TorD/DmsD family molecular chaperone [Neobacillus drentensis]|uniref:TorD/DmsD family molecular chaperone n=1 Tax=Neobacillus drentensis TaxID=220684 RepID=UPI00285A0DA2|nr:molecular chaperone TorD family protein [Neobacillus drentensis]MDR7236937.1 TorA maturation chaperone TorD [Neobacillus drentensis]
MTKLTVIHMDQGDRLLLYQLFWHYYRGDLMKLTTIDWANLAELLRTMTVLCESEFGNQAITILDEVSEETLHSFVFDYNRLFVGPNRLLASPYESTYSNFEGTIMQQETIKVRNFYHYEGLQVAEEGQYPDDHIQYELEFICYLLNQNEKGPDLKLFLENHFFKWVDKHCERIEEHSQNQLTLAFAYLLKEFLQFEKIIIEGGEPNVN